MDIPDVAANDEPANWLPRAADVSERAADFFSYANVALDEMRAEAAALRASGAQEADPRVVRLARDFALMESVISAANTSVTALWVKIRTRM